MEANHTTSVDGDVVCNKADTCCTIVLASNHDRAQRAGKIACLLHMAEAG